jgi:rhodanese-related sulfurtransferase
MSLVNQVPPAASACAGDHFASQLAFYTDPYSVHTDLLAGTTAVAPIDLRDVDEYARGHLPGAMRIDYASISSLPADVIPDGVTPVTYCSGPGCLRAHVAALKFANLGIPVKVMVGGYEAWRRYRYTLERGQSTGAKVRRPT